MIFNTLSPPLVLQLGARKAPASLGGDHGASLRLCMGAERARSTKTRRRRRETCALAVGAAGSTDGNNGGPGANLLDRFFAAQSAGVGPVAGKLFTLMLATPTVPIGSYVSTPETFLHKLDPRVKQLWLFVLMLLPGKCGLLGKFTFAAALVALPALALPRRVWLPQLLQLGGLCALLLVFAAVGADAVPPITQPRLPPGALELLPASVTGSGGAGYSYVLAKLGPLQVTRRGASLAASAALLTFTLLQSAFLCLATTPPEATSAALRWVLGLLRVPADEVALLLLLSLRFLSLVFEEARNIALGVAVRGIEWRGLGGLGALAVGVGLVRRMAAALFEASERIAEAMEARRYGGPEQAVAAMQYAAPLAAGWRDALSLAVLGILIWSVVVMGGRGLF